jgi:AraC-like DNA-binding protein
MKRGANHPRRPSREAPLPPWLVSANHLSDILGVLEYHVPIACSIAPFLPGSVWRVLQKGAEQIFDLEGLFGTTRNRDVYNWQNVRLVGEKKRTRLSHLGIFADLTVPILHDGRVEGLLCAGPFLTREPTREALNEHWAFHGSGPPSAFDTLAVQFVRNALSLVRLDAAELDAYRRLLETLSEALVGEGDCVNASRRVDALRRTLARSPASTMRRVTNLIDPVHNRHWKSNQLYSWDKAELGMEHLPNVVIAVLSQASASNDGDLIDSLIAGHRLRDHCARFAKSLPETLAAPFEEDGAYFLTYIDNKLSRVKSRRVLQTRVQKIVGALQGELKTRVVVGVGRLGGRGEDLPTGARQAALAVQLAVHRELPLLFFEDLAETGERLSGELPSPGVLAQRIIEVFESTAFAELESTMVSYVRSVLAESRGRAAVVRAYVESLLASLMVITERRAQLDARSAQNLRVHAESLIGSAPNSGALLAVLRTTVVNLERITRAPARAHAELKMDRIVRFITDNCHERLTLSRVARQAGLSPNYFSATFKQRFGAGFASVLVDQRLERAKKLLRAGVLPIHRVGNEAGFVSVPHFHKAFRRRFHMTPAQYRAQSENRPDPEEQAMNAKAGG